jgi:hypothetical protein
MTAPRGRIALRMPWKAPVGLPKTVDHMCQQLSVRWFQYDLHALHCGISCTALMICESNPDVISIPMQVGNSIKYMYRKFFFLYHGTLSSKAMRWTILSPVLAVPTILKVSRLDQIRYVLVSRWGEKTGLATGAHCERDRTPTCSYTLANSTPPVGHFLIYGA